MICGNCRYVNRDNAQICRHCGAPLDSGTPETEGIVSGLNTAKSREAFPGNKSAETPLKKYGIPLKEFTAPRKEFGTSHKEPGAVPEKANAARALKTESLPSKEDNGEERRQRGGRFVAAVLTIGAVVIAGVAVFAVLFLGKAEENKAASAATVMPTPEVTAVLTPMPSATQVPTTTPVPTEDISSIFTHPSDPITGG